MDQSNDEADEDTEDQPYIDADTDLIPGTYEGGLKTWEGGLDLVQVCSELQDQMEGGVSGWIRGKSVLEVRWLDTTWGSWTDELLSGRLRNSSAHSLPPPSAHEEQRPIFKNEAHNLSSSRLQSRCTTTRDASQPDSSRTP